MTPPLRPWSQTPSSADPAEQKAIELAKALRPVPPLSNDASERIVARLRSAPPAGTGAWWKLPVVGGVLVIAAVIAWRFLSQEPAPQPQVVAVEPVAVAAPAPAPVVEAPLKLKEADELPPVRSKRPTATPAESALVAEARLLGVAVEQLRKQARPKAALATLNRYFTRYPDGALKGEAEVTRIDAWLAAGMKTRALERLDQLHREGLEELPRKLELMLQRAELLFEARRHAAAREAFDELLALNPPPALAERALFGRAVSHAHEGSLESMRADLAAYLERFPEGRFAAQARERLGEK